VTLFMFLLACLKALLYHRTRQTDILVGTYFASQSHPELEDVMGPRTNLVPLRTDLSGNPSFAEVLLRVREVVLDAQAHQDLPFEHLCSALQAAGKAAPPIQAIVLHTHVEWPLLRLDNVRSVRSSVHGKGSAWGFSMNIVNKDNRDHSVTVGCSFDVTQHDPGEVRTFTAELLSIAQTFMAHPSLKLDELAARA